MIFFEIWLIISVFLSQKSSIYEIYNDNHCVISSKNAIFALEIIWNANAVRG